MRQKNELIWPTEEYTKKAASVHLQGLGTTVIVSHIAAQPFISPWWCRGSERRESTVTLRELVPLAAANSSWQMCSDDLAQQH